MKKKLVAFIIAFSMLFNSSVMAAGIEGKEFADFDTSAKETMENSMLEEGLEDLAMVEYNPEENVIIKAATKGTSSKVKSNKEWYKKILNSKKGSYKVLHQEWTRTQVKTVRRKDFTHYKIMDINKDGIKELILATPRKNVGSDNRYLVLTYYKNKVVPLICFVAWGGARGSLAVHNKGIILSDGGSKEGFQIEYRIAKGKIKKVKSVECTNYRPTNSTYVQRYLINGRKVSQTAGRKAFDKMNKRISKGMLFT